jgi:hypothetical protein
MRIFGQLVLVVTKGKHVLLQSEIFYFLNSGQNLNKSAVFERNLTNMLLIIGI